MKEYLLGVSNFCDSILIPILLVFLIFFGIVYFMRKSNYYKSLGYFLRSLSQYVESFANDNNVIPFAKKEDTDGNKSN